MRRLTPSRSQEQVQLNQLYPSYLGALFLATCRSTGAQPGEHAWACICNVSLYSHVYPRWKKNLFFEPFQFNAAAEHFCESVTTSSWSAGGSDSSFTHWVDTQNYPQHIPDIEMLFLDFFFLVSDFSRGLLSGDLHILVWRTNPDESIGQNLGSWSVLTVFEIRGVYMLYD